jgi:hypothetical protein
MTARPALAALGSSAFVLVAAVALWWAELRAYLDHPLAPSSTSGNRVFRFADGSFVAYAPYVPGPELTIALVATVAVALATVIAACTWRPQPSSRRRFSTAGAKASAHTR